MSDCCKKLEAEIAALSAAIAGLDSRFVRRPELPQLRAEILGAIPALLGAYATRDQIAGLASKSELTKYLTRADGNTIADAARSRLERSFALKSDLPPLERQAREAIEKAGRATTKAEGAKSLADKALGGINRVESALDGVEQKARDALGKAGKALGASESALSKAGQALSRAGDAIARVASIAGAVAGLLALVGLFMSVFPRLDAHDRQLDSLNAGMSRILSAVQSMKNELQAQIDGLLFRMGRNEYGLDLVRSNMATISAIANKALAQANRAFDRASMAVSQSIAAEKVAAGAAADAAIASAAIAGVTGLASSAASLAGSALRTAGTAQGTANRALSQAGRSGRDGAPGRPGRDGAPGRPGRDGKDGKDAVNLTPAAIVQIVNSNAQSVSNRIRPFIINTGTGGAQTMRPQDLALLRRIDSTTRANLSVSRSNSVQNSIMLGLQQRTNGLIANVQNTANLINQNLGKLAKWLHLDRLLNLLTFVTSFHNAYHLSSGLTQTLFSATSNVLAVFGFKDANGSAVDVGALIGGSLDNQMKAIFGVDNWTGIKAEWKKYNRIYQAAANLMFSIQSMIYNVQESLNIVAGWIAQMGNGLRKDGVVSEGVWRRFNPNPDFKNPFFSAMERLENLEEATSQIDQIASNVLSVQETATQIVKQKEELGKAVAQLDGSRQGAIAPDATKVAEAEAARKLVSVSVPIPQSAETAGS